MHKDYDLYVKSVKRTRPRDLHYPIVDRDSIRGVDDHSCGQVVEWMTFCQCLFHQQEELVRSDWQLQWGAPPGNKPGEFLQTFVHQTNQHL